MMRLMGRAGGVAALALALAAPAAAQQSPVTAPAAGMPAPAANSTAAAATTTPRTLADLRADLYALGAELKSLRAELNASGAAGFKAAGGDSAIDRMNALEREMARLTGETEKLRNRIDRIVSDGTNRIGDIEFRLCEMEDGCDLGALTTPGLGDLSGGGMGLTQAPLGSALVAPADIPLTSDEKVAFDAASVALQAGDFAQAATLFGQFAETHGGSPAAPEALFLKGAALDSAGDAKAATAAWLQAFAAAPTGPRAPDALLGLSRVSSAGGAAVDGCLYLTELATRFADTPQAVEGARRSAEAGCDAALIPDAVITPDAGVDLTADPAADPDPDMDADPEAAADLADGG